MRYLMLVHVEPGTADHPDAPPVEDWARDVDARGARVVGDRLRPAEDATTVRVRDGRPLVTDGPFAETRDLIGGFDVIDAADLDEAIAIASGHPVAWSGALELRPFWPLEEG